MALLEKIHGKEISADTRLEDLSGAVVPSKPVVDLEAKPNDEGMASQRSKASNALMKVLADDALSPMEQYPRRPAAPATTLALGKVDPKEAYQRIRERMLELEIEKDEQAKALSLLKEVREREKAQFEQALEEAREDGSHYAEQVKNEMALRIEKQVQMIESLLEDKR